MASELSDALEATADLAHLVTTAPTELRQTSAMPALQAHTSLFRLAPQLEPALSAIQVCIAQEAEKLQSLESALRASIAPEAAATLTAPIKPAPRDLLLTPKVFREGLAQSATIAPKLLLVARFCRRLAQQERSKIKSRKMSARVAPLVGSVVLASHIRNDVVLAGTAR